MTSNFDKNIEKKFNCIDEPWIPIANHGQVSLRQVFSDESLECLGGTPIQKIAVFKLLQAITQAACPLSTESAWDQLTQESFKAACLSYLDKWHDAFWLYGPRPFLQMPEIKEKAKKVVPFGALNPEKASGNTTFLTASQIQMPLSDAEKAMLIVTLMSFAPGGKKVDNSIVLSKGYTGKTSSGKPGPGLGFKGYLHTYAMGQNLLETLRLNLFTEEKISSMGYLSGVGTAPWEKMPQSEDCPVAQALKNSLMGRLVSLNRFCLLAPDGMYYCEGIAYGTYADGAFEPTQFIGRKGNKSLKYETLWADPDKKPWRSLTSLLSFLKTNAQNQKNCLQLELGVKRCSKLMKGVTVWSGGQRFTSQAGEQYMSGGDDVVESIVKLEAEDIQGDLWFSNFSLEISNLEKYAQTLYSAIFHYYSDCKAADKGKALASKACASFWQESEIHLQELIEACTPGNSTVNIREKFKILVHKNYNDSCPRETAKQLMYWAKNRIIFTPNS